MQIHFTSLKEGTLISKFLASFEITGMPPEPRALNINGSDTCKRNKLLNPKPEVLKPP